MDPSWIECGFDLSGQQVHIAVRRLGSDERVRLAAEIVRLSAASNRGARARVALALAIWARRAWAVGEGLTCFVPGMGADTPLKRSGTVMSIESMVMRPSTLGFCASLPLSISGFA